MSSPIIASVIRFPSARLPKTSARPVSPARRKAAALMKLQVFTGSIDGSRRALVAAGSRSEAIRSIQSAGFSIDGTHFSRFFCQSANVAERALAISAPGVVFSRANAAAISPTQNVAASPVPVLLAEGVTTRIQACMRSAPRKNCRAAATISRSVGWSIGSMPQTRRAIAGWW